MATDAQRAWHSLTVVDTSEIASARRLAGEVARQTGLPEERCVDVRLAVSELVTNALEYGAGGVRLDVSGDSGALEVAVSAADSGSIPTKAFEPPDPSRIRGRGLYIVARAADVVTVLGERGTITVRCVFNAGSWGASSVDATT